MKETPHMVCIGATGMLWGAVERWHEEGQRLTLMARRPERVASAIAQMDSPAPEFIAVDYRDDVGLVHALGQVDGEVDCLVAWVHGSAPDALDVMVDLLQPVRLIHVLGSAAAHPLEGIIEPLRARYASRVELYQQVVLGFVSDGDGQARWLTHEEISEGVWRAHTSTDHVTIVGLIEPWEDRP